MAKNDLSHFGSVCIKDPEALVKKSGRQNELIVVRDNEIVLIKLEFVIKVLAQLSPMQASVKGQKLVHNNW